MASLASIGLSLLVGCIISFDVNTLIVGCVCVFLVVLWCISIFLFYRRSSICVESAIVLTKDGEFVNVFANQFLTDLCHTTSSCFKENIAFAKRWKKAFDDNQIFIKEKINNTIANIDRQIPNDYTYLLHIDINPQNNEMKDFIIDIVEYEFLNFLSRITTTYYDKHDDIKLQSISRDKIAPYLQKNKILDLLSKDFRDRANFTDVDINKKDFEYVFSITNKNTGITYERFEMGFPKKTTINRDEKGTLVVKSSFFTLRFKCDFYSSNYNLPFGFAELILRKSPRDVIAYHIPMKLTIKLKLWQIIAYDFVSKYQWIGSLLTEFSKFFSFDSYLKQISFDQIRTQSYVNANLCNKIKGE